jgi:orotidine-5'-phosphate decarboxylase
MNNSPVIIALDVESAAEARALVASIGDAASFYKVGLELYAAAGMEFVRELKGAGHRVFLDLKLHDIAETVRRATAQVARVGVDFLTVHATVSAMKAAAAGRGDSGVQLLGVTVLTDVDQEDLARDGYARELSELVELRVRNAMDAGMDGIVCSALEVARVRAIGGAKLTLVTPGVRSAGAAAGDQKRVATPREAIDAGADFLVIGRQVTRAKDPRGEVLRILEEVATAGCP